ncbi:hypothetical protein SteCoe_3385 [Stentor coeruleus]|uniref:Uncharacterized protein n=1 Tax=Stentor coeruleus TaxID=5963 RepID=A0A1R2CX17_9CILI|nr:hypothetical protein SteCoe_3385 [Stentor coeruleus]
MGRAPPHMIYKRIVKGIMKKIIPGSLKEVSEAEELMVQCWAVNGVGSKKCAAEVKAYSEMQLLNKKYEKFIENKKYEMHAMKYLAPAERKYDEKGRFHVSYFNNQRKRFQLRGIDLDTPQK